MKIRFLIAAAATAFTLPAFAQTVLTTAPPARFVKHEIHRDRVDLAAARRTKHEAQRAENRAIRAGDLAQAQRMEAVREQAQRQIHRDKADLRYEAAAIR